jgi:hypothetical protein
MVFLSVAGITMRYSPLAGQRLPAVKDRPDAT